MLYHHEDIIYSDMDNFNWDDEVFEMEEFRVSIHGWLTADDPVFWCLAPTNLEEATWLFITAPSHQPYDCRGYPITLLEFYLRKDFFDLLAELWLAPKRIYEVLRMVWTRVTKRRKLSKKNLLNHSSGPELEWLFERDTDLPPSWEVTLMDPCEDNLKHRITFANWIIDETVL